MLLPAIIELTMADDVEDEGDDNDDNGCDNLCFLCGGWQPQEVPVDASKFVSQSILRNYLNSSHQSKLFWSVLFFFFNFRFVWSVKLIFCFFYCPQHRIFFLIISDFVHYTFIYIFLFISFFSHTEKFNLFFFCVFECRIFRSPSFDWFFFLSFLLCTTLHM